MPPRGNVFSRELVTNRVASDLLGSGDGPVRSPPAPDDSNDPRTSPIGALFALSRRLELPFGVLVLRLHAPNGNGVGEAALSTQLWELIEGHTRETDAVSTWGADGALVGCPATSSDGTRELVSRLRASAGDLPVGIGAASFVEDGLTLSDLIACASEREAAAHGDGKPPRPPRGPFAHRARAARLAAGAGLSLAAKRFFDLLVVAASAPAWLPLLALVAAVVKISNPSAPVLFVQQRTGRGGQRFRMFKFRTMVPDAEQRKTELAQRNERSWPDFKIDADPRVTRLGRYLRATSLEELPQIWNVLRGEMSLVGPRPTSFPAATYRPWQTARLEASPGLTGLWQVEARNCTDLSERIRIDLRYVKNRSFFYDLKILLRTVPAVLWHREGR
jgi:lipopolysaccharide/colanic/teichoic acid biosynthesis glycosyltransferase